jgi:cytidine deaminase
MRQGKIQCRVYAKRKFHAKAYITQEALTMPDNPLPTDPLQFPELVFGLIGAVGTDSEKILEALKGALTQVKYELVPIHLIVGVRQVERWSQIPTEPLDARYTSHMDAGNEFRKVLNRGDALALLGAASIAKERTNATGTRQTPRARTAYALRSLKRPEEIWALRNIYGRNFFALAAYSAKSRRLERLASKIAISRSTAVSPGIQRVAEELVERDEAELQEKLGQNIREAFPISDFFVDADSPRLPEQVERIVELIFGHLFHTPTREEYGMFHAWAASLRSASLGRQVGAAVCTEAGDLLSTGCNEVPKAHGGLYWPGDQPDARDHQRGEDSNDVIKQEILNDLLDRLKKGKWLSKAKSSMASKQLLEEALADASPDGLKKATLMGITEYGRMVHAEMASLMQAARLGIPLHDAIMFSTTFPCHNCTKHIVAAGIKRVIYIEPYPKSRASELHGDSIAVEQDPEDPKRVSFRSFVGLSPRQYFRLFSVGDAPRKEGSKVKKWKPEDAAPRLAESPFAYLPREEEQLTTFDNLLAKYNLIPVGH